MGNTALLKRLTGDAESTLRLGESALEGFDTTLTRDHDYSFAVAQNLASDLAMLGETAEVRALGEATLVCLRKLMGENHPQTSGAPQIWSWTSASTALMTMRSRCPSIRCVAMRTPMMQIIRRQSPPRRGRRRDFNFDSPPI